MKKRLYGLLCIMLVMIGILSVGKVKTCTAATQEKFAAVYNVKDKKFGAKSGKDSTEAIQDALDKAAGKATAKKRVQVYIPSGTYYISKTLQIDSNVYLKCDNNTKIIKKGKKILYMLRSAKNNKKGFNNVKNITIEGGIWDAKFIKFTKSSGGSLFFFVHAQNLEFLNLTLKNNFGSHLLELGGAKNVTVSGCKMYGFKSANKSDKEAIQLDVCHNYSILPDGGPYDDTPCQDIVIENNEIYNYPRAIGSHSFVQGIYPSNITIRDNYIHDISQNAIYGYNYRNFLVTNNRFEKVYAAVVFKSYATEGTQTIFKRNKGVKAMAFKDRKYNLVITDNTIDTKSLPVTKNTMQLGVFVYGTKEAPINKVTVARNIINSASTGIYLRYVNEATVEDNTCSRKNNSSGGKFLIDAYKFLTCSDNTIQNNTVNNTAGNLYDNGFAFRENSKNNCIIKNEVVQVGKHGMGVYDSSSAVIVNNSINKAGQHGVAIVEKSSANISDNMIDGSGANGMLISASTGEILNNKISNSGSTGISIQNKSSLSRVSQNELMNNTGKAIAINNSTIKASTGNCMISRESEFEITSVSSDTTLETIRTLTVLNVTPNSTTVSGTCNLTGPVYAVIDGVTYTGIISKREYSISIPNQVVGTVINIYQEDVTGNHVYLKTIVK